MQRAAIYARFSTDLQRDRSIDDQVALRRRHAESQGLTVGKVCSDRARTSASLFGRERLLSPMEDARARRFEVVVVEGLDRISRDQEDLAGIHRRLSFAGVDITEPRHDAEVLEALREIVAEVRTAPGEGTAVVEVFGRLAALTGGQVDPVGGLVVAEEGLEPPTRGL